MLRPWLVILTLQVTVAAAWADWKDDTDYTLLQQTFTSGVPTLVPES